MEGEMDPGHTTNSDHTSSSNSDELNGKAAEDENDATTSSTAGGRQQAEESDSDLEMVETDDEDVEEITIIELSDTEIREEEEDDDDNDSEDEEEFVIKEEPPDDYEDGVVNFDPSQLGLIVTQTELPEDLIGDPANGMYKCRFCPSKFPSKLRLVAHIERHINNGAIRKCRFCEFYTAIKQTLLEHECKHTKEKPYQCSICSYRCRLKGDLGRHMEVHSNTKRYRCKECGHQTRSAGNLKRHMERHQPDIPRNFVCSLCGAAFKRRSALQLHTNRRHTEGKPFCCDQCSFCSKTMWELKTHKAKHSDHHPFRCSWPGCQKAFKTKSDCTKHMKRHSGIKNYECNICSKKFFNSTLLRKHSFAHSEVRNFECGQCLKRFKTLRDLKVHLSTHQWVKPFACEVCYKTFASQFNLDKHMEMHGGGRPYQCPVCLHGSRQMEHLMAHVGSEHLHNFTYVCVLCRKPFRKSMHLQFHFQRCHKDAMQGRGEGTLVYDPDYLDHNFQPEATGTFHPTTFAKLLASENLKAAWPAVAERDTAEVKQEPGLVNTISDHSGVSSGSPGEAPSMPSSKQLPPVVQLGRYAGIPFCLARRNSGLQLNCQKKGKKPRGWFMDPAQMSQADAQHHRQYLQKKELGLLPPSHRRRGPTPKTSRRGGKGGGARHKARGKGRWGSRALSVKEDEDSEDDEDAYMLARQLVWQLESEGPTQQADGQSHRASPRARKPAVHFKNLPGDYFDSRPKKCRIPPEDSKAHLGFLLHPSTSCYPAGKTADRKRNNKRVGKKTFPQSSKKHVNKKPSSGRGSLPSGRKASPGRKRKGGRGDHSWASALAGPLPVSHYRPEETALNTRCWLNALRSSAPRGRFTPWAQTSTLPTSILQPPGGSREEFFARCLQLQVRMPSHHNASDLSQSSAPSTWQEEACDGGLAEEHGNAWVETVTGVVTDGNSWTEAQILHHCQSEDQSDLSIWQAAKECVQSVVDAVSKGRDSDGQVTPDTNANSGSCHVGVNRDVPNSDNSVVEISRGVAVSDNSGDVITGDDDRHSDNSDGMTTRDVAGTDNVVTGDDDRHSDNSDDMTTRDVAGKDNVVTGDDDRHSDNSDDITTRDVAGKDNVVTGDDDRHSDNSDDMTTRDVAGKDASLFSVVVVDEVEASSVWTSQSDVNHSSTQHCNNTTHTERTGNEHILSLEEKSPFASDVVQTLKEHSDSPADGEIIGTHHVSTMENNIGNDHQQDGHFEYQGDNSREGHSISTLKPLENIAQCMETSKNNEAIVQCMETSKNNEAIVQCMEDTAAEKRSEVQALPMEMADEKETDKEPQPEVSIVQKEEEGGGERSLEHCSAAPWEKVASQGEVHTDTLLSEDNIDGEEDCSAEWDVEETSFIITETRSLAPQHCLAEDSGQQAMEDAEDNVHLIKTEESVTELSAAPPSQFSKCLHVLVSDVQIDPCTVEYLHSLGVSRVVFTMRPFPTDHTTRRAKCTTRKVLNHSTKKTLKSLSNRKTKQAASKTTKQQNKKLVTKNVLFKRPRGKSCALKSPKVKKPCEVRVENNKEKSVKDSLTDAFCIAPGARVSGISALLLASATATKPRKSLGKSASHSVNSRHTKCVGKASSRATALKRGKSSSKAKRPMGQTKALSPKPSKGAKQRCDGGGTKPAQKKTQTVKKCQKWAGKKSVRPSESPAASSVDEDVHLTSAAGDDGEVVPSGVSISQPQVHSHVDLTTPSLSTAASPGPSEGCVKPPKKSRKANLPGKSVVRVASFHGEPPVKKRGRPKKIPLDGSLVSQYFDPNLSLLAGQDQTGVSPAAEETGVLSASSYQAPTRKVLFIADMSKNDKTDNSSAQVIEPFTKGKETLGTEGRQPVKTKRKYTKQKKNIQKKTPPENAAKRRGRPKTKVVRDELADTASTTTISAVSGSENSAFKISKPLRKEESGGPRREGGGPGRRRSKQRHEASLEKGRKRKKYMYVETDTGEFPDPPAKKRGRPPGPKIILDRSQVNLCFDQVAPGDQDHSCADLAARGVTQDLACQEMPHTLHCATTVSQPRVLHHQGGLLNTDLPQFFTAHLLSPFVQSACAENASQLPVSAAACVAQIGEGQMTEHPVAELGAGSGVVADVKPTVSELNQYVTYPEVKPNVGELSALSGSAASQTVLAETCAVPAASVTAPQSSASLTSCHDGDSLRAQLLQVLTSHMDACEGDACRQPRSSAVHPRVKPIILSPSRGRKRKLKDRTFHVQPRYKHPSGMSQDAEVRRSDRRKKARLTEEQIRQAAGLDWADSDPDGEEGDAAFYRSHPWHPDGEDVGKDVEFVGVDYSHVDLDAQRLSLEDLTQDTVLGTDVGEEGTFARPASEVHVSSIPQDQNMHVVAPPANLTEQLGNEAHTRLVTEGQPGDGSSSCMAPAVSPSLSPVNQTFTVQVSDRGCVVLAMDEQKGSGSIPPHLHNQQGGCGLGNKPVRSPISVSRLTNGVELTVRPATPPIPLTHPLGTCVTSGLSPNQLTNQVGASGPNQLANQMGASVASSISSSQLTNQIEVPIGSGLSPLTISVKTSDGRNVLLDDN